MPPTLQQLLKTMVDHGASDLHISHGSPPQIRIDGHLVRLKAEPLSEGDTREICCSVMSPAQREQLEAHNELDLSFGIKGLARFRANVFWQKGSVAGAFRMIPAAVRPFDELGLPPAVAELCRRPRGLILVTGPTGSGKSTTLAALIDLLNEERRGHIITVEDPIEFVHENKGCIVSQRELHSDTRNVAAALRSVLRQDPDVVLIGEVRDRETIETVLTVAETGHLTLATLHTGSCVQSISRVIDIFPSHQQAQVRTQLASVLEGVLSQTLVPRIGGGRALALELLIATPAVRNLIREDKTHQIYSQMQLGQGKSGMQTLNQALAALVAQKKITLEEAAGHSADPEELKSITQTMIQTIIQSSGPAPAVSGAPRRL